MVNLQDVKTSSYEIGLSKLTGLKIKDVHGYISHEFGDPVIKVTYIEFEDGQHIGVEGEHDFPYLTPYPKYNVPNMDDETLEELYRQENPNEEDDTDD